jgi:hypothetical protein
VEEFGDSHDGDLESALAAVSKSALLVHGGDLLVDLLPQDLNEADREVHDGPLLLIDPVIGTDAIGVQDAVALVDGGQDQEYYHEDVAHHTPMEPMLLVIQHPYVLPLRHLTWALLGLPRGIDNGNAIVFEETHICQLLVGRPHISRGVEALSLLSLLLGLLELLHDGLVDVGGGLVWISHLVGVALSGAHYVSVRSQKRILNSI